MKYTIIGNSFAGVFAVEAIRKIDREGGIRVISEEKEPAYSPAMLHEYLSGAAGKELLYLRSPDFYEKNGVETLLGQSVTGLDTENRSFSIGNTSVTFDRLLIATGGTPFIPPGIGGLDDFDRVYTFTRKSGVDSMIREMTGVKSVVVLGAGLIGLQCAEGLAQAGVKVTAVELADKILPMALDDNAAGLVLKELHKEGIEVITGDTITQLNGRDSKIDSVTLKSGGEIDCEMVVVAVGVRPNIDFIKESGIKIDRGVLVGDRMETNIPNIFAAGDCAQGMEMLSGKKMPLPIIPIATRQGMIAGHNMAGGKKIYNGGISLNSLQFGGLQVISYGFIRDEEGAYVLEETHPSTSCYRKIIIKDGALTGVVLVKDIERAGLFRYLIENRVRVEEFKEKLMLPDFGVAHLPASIRDEMFTRPV